MNPRVTIFALAVLVALSYGLYQAMVVAPTEQSMGDIQRIFYYHVPSAFVAFACFFANAVASVLYLIKRSPGVDAFAVSTAELGVVFCSVVLVTGPLWARPVWLIWWTWDARLTSTLLLWLIYVSYLLLRRFAAAGQAPVLSAVLSVFGAMDVIFVYYSIQWFRTQHPSPVLTGEGYLDPAMKVAFWTNVATFFFYASLILWLRIRMERTAQQVEQLHALRAQKGGD